MLQMPNGFTLDCGAGRLLIIVIHEAADLRVRQPGREFDAKTDPSHDEAQYTRKSGSARPVE